MAKKNECPNCGNDVSEKDAYCKYCGTANPYYKGTATSSSNSEQQSASQTSSNTTSNPEATSADSSVKFSRNQKIWAWVLCILCLPIGLSYIGIVHHRLYRRIHPRVRRPRARPMNHHRGGMGGPRGGAGGMGGPRGGMGGPGGPRGGGMGGPRGGGMGGPRGGGGRR